jgi:hypothetical protein
VWKIFEDVDWQLFTSVNFGIFSLIAVARVRTVARLLLPYTVPSISPHVGFLLLYRRIRKSCYIRRLFSYLFAFAVVRYKNETESLNTCSKFVSLPFYRLQRWVVLDVVGMFTLLKYFADGMSRPGQCIPIMYWAEFSSGLRNEGCGSTYEKRKSSAS